MDEEHDSYTDPKLVELEERVERLGIKLDSALYEMRLAIRGIADRLPDRRPLTDRQKGALPVLRQHKVKEASGLLGLKLNSTYALKKRLKERGWL